MLCYKFPNEAVNALKARSQTQKACDVKNDPKVCSNLDLAFKDGAFKEMY